MNEFNEVTTPPSRNEFDKDKLMSIYYSLFNQTECFCAYKDSFNNTERLSLSEMLTEIKNLNWFESIYLDVSEDQDSYFEIINDKFELDNNELIYGFLKHLNGLSVIEYNYSKYMGDDRVQIKTFDNVIYEYTDIGEVGQCLHFYKNNEQNMRNTIKCLPDQIKLNLLQKLKFIPENNKTIDEIFTSIDPVIYTFSNGQEPFDILEWDKGSSYDDSDPVSLEVKSYDVKIFTEHLMPEPLLKVLIDDKKARYAWESYKFFNTFEKKFNLFEFIDFDFDPDVVLKCYENYRKWEGTLKELVEHCKMITNI